MTTTQEVATQATTPEGATEVEVTTGAEGATGAEKGKGPPHKTEKETGVSKMTKSTGVTD